MRCCGLQERLTVYMKCEAKKISRHKRLKGQSTKIIKQHIFHSQNHKCMQTRFYFFPEIFATEASAPIKWR